MYSKFLMLSKENLKSALVYAFLLGSLAMFIYVQDLGSIFLIDWKVLVNTGAMALIGAIISLIKNLLTTNEGKFLGAVKVK